MSHAHIHSHARTQSAASLHHYASSSSSRASSPASSVTSNDHQIDPHYVVEHQRERNWNSPHPKWGAANHSTSKLERRRSLVLSSASVNPTSPSHASRRNSIDSQSTEDTHHQTVVVETSPQKSGRSRTTSLSGSRNNGSQDSSREHRIRVLPRTSASSSAIPDQGRNSISPSSSTIRSRSPLPPTGTNDEDRESYKSGHVRALSSPSPIARPSSRSSAVLRQSHIPVATSNRNGKDPIVLSGGHNGSRVKDIEFHGSGKTLSTKSSFSDPVGLPESDHDSDLIDGKFFLLCSAHSKINLTLFRGRVADGPL